jgi:DNA-binding GntR family transcriptional regulator
VSLARRRSKASSPPLAASPRSELVDSAYTLLREFIVSGRLAPGAPIIETEMAASLGIRRAHLRTALQRLQHSGLVVTSAIGSYSRSRVAPLTRDDMEELFTLVGAIEGAAARNAARLPERDGLVAKLRSINAELLDAARERPANFSRANDLDVAFHRQYVLDAAGPRVRALHDTVKPQADRYELLYTTALIDQIELSVAEHELIIEAIASGDADMAQHAVEANWRNAAERFRGIIEHAGERGNL